MLVATKRVELLSTASETGVLPLDEVAIAMPAFVLHRRQVVCKLPFLVRFYIVPTRRDGVNQTLRTLFGSGRNRTASYEIRIGAECRDRTCEPSVCRTDALPAELTPHGNN